MAIQLPAYFDEMLAETRGPQGRAANARSAVDAFFGPSPTAQQPLIDPEIALLAGMPDVAQYGMHRQAQNDRLGSSRDEMALKLLTLLQGGQSQDDRTMMGWSGMQEDSRQFDARQGMDMARMGMQDDQFGRQLNQRAALAEMANQQGWAELMGKLQMNDADRAMKMQGMQMELPIQQQQSLATLVRALGERDRQSAMAEAYRSQIAKANPAAAGQPAAASDGGSGTNTLLGLLIAAGVLGGGYKGLKYLKGRGAAGAAGAAGGAGDDIYRQLGESGAATRNASQAAAEEAAIRGANLRGAFAPDDVYRRGGDGGSSHGGFGGLLGGPSASPVDDILDAEFTIQGTGLAPRPTTQQVILQKLLAGPLPGAADEVAEAGLSSPSSPVEQLLLLLKGPEARAAQPWSPYMAVDPALESAMAARAAAGPKMPGTPPGRGFKMSYPPPATVPGAASPPLEAMLGQMDPPTQEAIMSLLGRSRSRIDPFVASWLQSLTRNNP